VGVRLCDSGGAAPITPPAGPEATTNTGLSQAVSAASMPPFEVMTRTGAAMSMERSPLSRLRRYVRMATSR
jgi:hypothetical protein